MRKLTLSLIKALAMQDSGGQLTQTRPHFHGWLTAEVASPLTNEVLPIVSLKAFRDRHFKENE